MSAKYLTFFFYSSLLLAAFFLFQIRYTLDATFNNWNFPQYALLLLLSLFFLLCCSRYYHYKHLLKNNIMAQLSEKEQAKQKILTMDPADLGKLITSLFQTKSAAKVHAIPQVDQPFYDIEMNLNDDKVMVSCLLKEQDCKIPQAYLDRLYSMMKNNQINQGAFITLGEFSYECYEFTKDKPISLINGDELINYVTKM